MQKFKYLRAVITSDRKCRTEIRNRIGQAKTAFQRMRNILANTSLSMNVRKRVLKCYIEPILLYGSESWTIGKSAQKSLEAAEMWFIRRMLRIPWTAKITNEECMRRAGETKNLVKKIRERQCTFIGHAMRRGGIENIITTGKIEGRRSRGRPREMILDSLTGWCERRSPTELMACMKDRVLWRSIIANASRHGT